MSHATIQIAVVVCHGTYKSKEPFFLRVRDFSSIYSVM